MEGLLHTMKTRSFLLLLLLLVILLLLATASADRRRGGSRRRNSGPRECPRVPGFRVNNVQPMALSRGTTTVVALLTSNCPFCIRQSEMLQAWYRDLQENGTDAHMMIINGGPRPAPDDIGTFEQRVSFSVYHDDNDRTIWRQVFQGNKDDIFILDRCGQRAYRIPFPYSYMGYTYVRRAFHKARRGLACVGCPVGPSDLHDRMMGDAPVLGGSGSIGSGPFNLGRNSPDRLRAFQRSGSRRSRLNYHRNVNRCLRNDSLSRELCRARRRFNRYRNRHGIHLHSRMREEETLRTFERSQERSMGPVF